MVIVRLKGLASARKKMADGSVRAYWYAWRGGPRIDAEPGSAAFMAEYTRHVSAKPAVVQAGTVAELIRLYEASSDYPKSQASVRAYRTYLGLIDRKFGTLPLAALEDRRTRGVFKDWRDTMKATPRKADYAWSVLNRLFNYGVDRGAVITNPCAKGGRLSHADRTENVWTDADISAVFAVAPFEVAIVIFAALWTGQRQGDLLGLSRSRIVNGVLTLRQGKKGKLVTMPVAGPLAEALERNPKRGPILFTSSDGVPWTEDGFRTSFGRVKEKAGIGDLHFHDLRGTFSNRAAAAGATTIEIASCTGHEVEGSKALGASYLHRSLELATNCIRLLEKNEAGTILQTGLREVANRPEKQAGAKINSRGRKRVKSSA